MSTDAIGSTARLASTYDVNVDVVSIDDDDFQLW